MKRLILISSIALVPLLAVAPAASAKTYKPNRTGDHVPNGCTEKDCTLREAVISANARAGSDKIILIHGKTYKLSLANPPATSENFAATGDLDINGGSLRIQSDDSKKLAKINAQGIDRVFEVGHPTTPASATFKLLKIFGGKPEIGDGGGIQVLAGTLNISKSAISGNSTQGDGGGVNVIGSAAARAALSIQSSTLSQNLANTGGALASSQYSSVSVTNSTIANNAAEDFGGGVEVFSSTANNASFSSVTIARNLGNSDNAGGELGGGLRNGGAPATIRNTIIAQNAVGTGGSDPDCSGGGYTFEGVNLLTNQTGCAGFTAPPGIIASPGLATALKNNGGPTKTIALTKSSPAINHAGVGSPKRDQRGEKRKKPDIGAFERE